MCSHVVQIPRSELPASWGSACTTTVMQFIFRSRERRNENDQIILLSHAVIIIRFWSKTSRRWPRVLKRKKDPEKRKRFPLFYTEGRYFLILVLIPKKQLCIYFSLETRIPQIIRFTFIQYCTQQCPWVLCYYYYYYYWYFYWRITVLRRDR